jgi:hypothetical protein
MSREQKVAIVLRTLNQYKKLGFNDTITHYSLGSSQPQVVR